VRKAGSPATVYFINESMLTVPMEDGIVLIRMVLLVQVV